MKNFTYSLLGVLAFVACDAGAPSEDFSSLRNFECPVGCTCICEDPGSSSSSSSGDGSSSSSGGPVDPLAALSDDFDGDLSDWTIFRPDEADRIEITNGGLEIDPDRRSVWYNNRTATQIGKLIGPGVDFMATTEISVSQLDGSPLDCTTTGNAATNWRLAMINMRSATGSSDAIHLGLGCTNVLGMTLEDKTTIYDDSVFNINPWSSGSMHSRICRVGDDVQVLASGDGVTWTLINTFNRPDLSAGDVFVGPAAYAYPQQPNLMSRFEGVEFASITSMADCM